ncbi:MAG: phenylalanine--tRNA ligase subunit alpha, partial [Candidatus Aenigmarchaeota archaeon]|nr:phenylalanine--tRNA ligase subunit alpha [Candidatus Aenigmarchaeota archaeon]
MLDKIKQLEKKIKEEIFSVQQSIDLLAIEKKYLARQKGELAQLIKRIGKLSNEEKPIAGQAFNQLKQKINQWLKQRQQELECQSTKDNSTAIDITLPGKKYLLGYLHPLTRVRQQVSDIFTSMGWQVLEGKEVETDYYNFTALNIPEGHPSRETFHTFYLGSGELLRSQTSPVQIRVMEKEKPPLKIVAPGRVFRPDATDASHSFMFHQVEGLAVDKDITFADLKGTLSVFVREMFGQETRLRFRPHFFPFTEPSAEIDISCIICGGSGCRVCSFKGWLEILGAGMVDPNVFGAVKYDPKTWQGFAFGMGVER